MFKLGRRPEHRQTILTEKILCSAKMKKAGQEQDAGNWLNSSVSSFNRPWQDFNNLPVKSWSQQGWKMAVRAVRRFNLCHIFHSCNPWQESNLFWASMAKVRTTTYKPNWARSRVVFQCFTCSLHKIMPTVLWHHLMCLIWARMTAEQCEAWILKQRWHMVQHRTVTCFPTNTLCGSQHASRVQYVLLTLEALPCSLFIYLCNDYIFIYHTVCNTEAISTTQYRPIISYMDQLVTMLTFSWHILLPIYHVHIFMYNIYI